MAVSSFWLGVVLVIGGAIALAWAGVLYRSPSLFRREVFRKRPWLAHALSGPLTPLVPRGEPASWSPRAARVAAAIAAVWGLMGLALGVRELLR